MEQGRRESTKFKVVTVSKITRDQRKRKENNVNAKNQSFTEEARVNLKLYTQLKAIYEEEGVTHKTHQFLTRITKKKVNNLHLT